MTANPTAAQVEAPLKRPEREWNDGDAAVVYVSGHGSQTGDGHWIALHDTDPDPPRQTAISTRELLGWLRETDIDHGSRLLVPVRDRLGYRSAAG